MGAMGLIERLAQEAQEQRGFVQRSPVRTGVWTRFLEAPGEPAALLLIPLRDTTSGKLCATVNKSIQDLDEVDWCTYNQSVVAASMDFETLVTRVLPFSSWWHQKIAPFLDAVLAANEGGDGTRDNLIQDLDAPRASGRASGFGPELLWCLRMLGVVGSVQARKESVDDNDWPSGNDQLRGACRLLREARVQHPKDPDPGLFAISINRPSVSCLKESVRTIKGDASREVFDIHCGEITWAIVDSGVDRRHPAFSASGGGERVARSLDFTRLGEMLRLASSPDEGDRQALRDEFGLSASEAQKLGRAIRVGDDVDWDLVERALEIDAGDDAYFDTLNPHGTQVAGILGAAGENSAEQPSGVAPDIQLIDLRVIERPEGNEHSEFHIISALQFIRHLNRNKDKPVVHGVNLSLSLPHSVTDYGCGQTPICEEADRLVSSGVVVVAAAGNYGFDQLDVGGPAQTGGYRDLSVTDPGNADSVITVGATHGKYPHRYGVSYFSSRGPTGDGRAKPDLVAPGESIVCPSQNQIYELCNGTSMAAPHVSGAAALLMARHRGLIGDPARIKRILCESATDLQRTPESQGYGLVDVLRAIQSI